jgi:predicted nuclease of restriction endonuclease-like (RecB) superfamily
MKQFYETYKDFPKLSTLLREISWSHNLAIFSRCKTVEEREFYLKLDKQESYSFRELDRQISASFFERTMVGNSKLSTVLRESNLDLSNAFKDSYVFEFLNLPEPHTHNSAFAITHELFICLGVRELRFALTHTQIQNCKRAIFQCFPLYLIIGSIFILLP